VRRKSLWTRLRNAPDQLRWLVVRTARAAFGLPTSLDTEDRRILEQEILPWFGEREEFRRVLFVGCDWYTRHYDSFFDSHEYWTLEKDAARRRYGAERHVVDSVANLAEHFPESSFELILMNGVLGWGLDDPGEAEAALQACATRLAPGGVLLLGWNDVPEKRILEPGRSPALRSLSPWEFPPFGSSRRVAPGRIRHTYEFYGRP
jgi:SAM-dependent methyltransferase